MLSTRSRAVRQGQWSLVGSLVALALLIGLAAALIPRMLTPKAQNGTGATPIERGQGAACTEYKLQIDQAVSMYKMDHDNQPPPTLDDLKGAKYGVTDDILHAPGCAFSISNGVVTETGHGMAVPVMPARSAPVNPNAPIVLSRPAPPPSSSSSAPTSGPGGVHLPPASGTDTSGGSE